MDFEIMLILIFLTLFLSTTLRSIIGFGDAIIAMPLLSMIMDLKIATPFYAFVAVTISFIIMVQTYKKVHFKEILKLLIATFIGIPFGIYILKEIDETIIKSILGIIIILFSLYNLKNPHLIHLKHIVFTYLFGFIAGMLGGAYNINGLPIAFFASFKKWDPQSFRSNLQIYFFITGIVLISSHVIVGNVTPFIIQTYLFIIPILLLGIFIGNKIHYRIDVNNFKKYVYLLLLLLGTLLLLNSWFFIFF